MAETKRHRFATDAEFRENFLAVRKLCGPKISAAKKGRTVLSQEQKDHISKIQTGRKLTPEWKANVVAALHGRKYPNRKFKNPDEVAKRTSEQWRGKPKTPEQKAKMSATRKEWWRKRKGEPGDEELHHSNH